MTTQEAAQLADTTMRELGFLVVEYPHGYYPIGDKTKRVWSFFVGVPHLVQRKATAAETEAQKAIGRRLGFIAYDNSLLGTPYLLVKTK